MMLAGKPDQALATAAHRANAAECLAADVAQLAERIRKFPIPRGILGMRRRSEAVRTLALALTSLATSTDDRPTVKLNVMATLTPMPREPRHMGDIEAN
jgi:hypothetical protein